MNRFLAFLSILLSLTACTNGPVVDLKEEMYNRPTITLTTGDGTDIPGIEGTYCTSSVCNTLPEVDYEALTYVPFTNSGELTLKIEWDKDSVESLEIRSYDASGQMTHRKLPLTQVDENTFVIETPLPDDETKIALHARIDFTNEGVTNIYFPIELQ